MSRLRLLLKNLAYFRGVNFAVILGMAVATAVLSGALMVGDSVRDSLRTLTLQRFGPIDDALISTHFFDASLCARLTKRNAPADLTPTILVTGGAIDSTNNNRTADVQIAAGAWIDVPPGKCIINGPLADALGITAPGDSILLSLPSDSDTPREAALDRRSRNETINELSVEVAQIVRTPGVVSMFNPTAGQRGTRNAWVNLVDLQDALDQPARVNAILAHNKLPATSISPSDELNDLLTQAVQLSDYGLTHQPVLDGKFIAIGSRMTYLAPPIVDAAEHLAHNQSLPLQEVTVNLLSVVSDAGPPHEANTQPGFAPMRQIPVEGKSIHYAVVAGLSELIGRVMAPDEVDINADTAAQLGAKPGDVIHLDFPMRGPDGQLHPASASLRSDRLTFKLGRILPMTGIGADPQLTPDYKGLTDANSVADWQPPEGLTIDKSLVTKADEKYWDRYRAAPKVFMNFNTAQSLWGGAFGQVTQLRIPANLADGFLSDLAMQISPASMRMTFRPIKQDQLAAAARGTDFSQYFFYFSFFLIVAAVLLVAMLFRLGIEQRARQFGLLSAVGISPGRLGRMALGEGIILALVGAVVGEFSGIGYTAMIMAALRTWWIGAVGTTALHLWVNPVTLIVGGVSGLIVAMLAVYWGTWRIGRTPIARLLSGSWESQTGRRTASGILLRLGGWLLLASGLACLGTAVFRKTWADEACLAGGSLLLCGFLTWLAGTLRPQSRKQSSFVGSASLIRLGIGNATRHRARSVLAISLIAFAVFTLIIVAAMRQAGVADTDNKSSGSGGYRLILQSGIPIYADLNNPAGRRLAGITDPDDPLFVSSDFTMMRRWAGQDISCLNLLRPTSPTILSVPKKMVDRHAFTFASELSPTENPWTLLDSDQGDAVPVIADDDTAQYILQLPLGSSISITDQLGRERQLKLVGTISGSIFQGELLMGDKNFRRCFPAQDGASVALIDCPSNVADPLSRRLSTELDEYSVSVDTTAQRLLMYQSVANTYLATFQTLGSLGLLLGTIGLGVVLVRSVLERKAELALLACIGFTRRGRVLLMLSENVYLLLLGLASGTICAVVAMLPTLLASARRMNWLGLSGTLLAVLVVGVMSASLAVWITGIDVSPADLRRE